MSAGRICIREVDVADAEESATQAAKRMQQRGVGTLVVLNAANQPVGIVTDRDLVERVMAEDRDPSATPLTAVMTRNPRMIREDDSIEAALALMRSGRFRRLPVVNRDKQLVGLLSLDDVLMLLAEEFAQIGQLLERETPQAVVAGNSR